MTINPENQQIHKPNKFLDEKINNTKIIEKILFKKNSDFHSIQVVQNKFGKFIKFSDTYQAGYIDTPYYKGNLPYINYFLIPYLMNKNIKDVLLIGLGSGIIINQFFKIFEKIKSIDIVDIEEYIFPLAQKYFDFQLSDKMNFYLQDALIYLKSAKKKYDLIIVDVAGNEGIDERFYSEEYLNLIKSKLKSTGIFISNLPSSRDIFNKKNKTTLDLLKNYSEQFSNIDIYSGETSNKIYYKVFYDIDETVYDITNLILICSNKKYKISCDYQKLNDIEVDIKKYLNDLVLK